MNMLRFSRALFSMLLMIPSVASGQRSYPGAEAIDRIVRAEVANGFSGVVVVAWHDSLMLNRAYSSPSRPLRPTDVFWIASMTKGFTAAAVLRLKRAGRLSLDDSIARFLTDAPPDKRGITIRQLLTHSAGLGGEYSGGGIADRSQAIHAILANDFIFPPGHGYKYGDDDYELLAAIIEVASGRTWEDFVQTELLIPLHLSNAAFACGLKNAPPVARRNETQRQGDTILRAPCDWAHKGANGMFASAEDLFRWSRAVMADAGLSELVRPQILVRKESPFNISYGYGVRVYTLDGKVVEVMHSGSGDSGNTSIVRSLTSGLTIIVLSNAGQHEGTTWASFVARRLATREGA